MPMDEYLQASVMTASPQRLHLMVIDKALNHSRQALEALDSGDLARAHDTCARAREFVAEMISGLRADQAPELVTQVKDYFLHVQKALHFADLRQDRVSAAHAVELLEGYRETWVELTSSVA